MNSAITKTIEDLSDRGNLSGVDVANIADVSKTTVSRWVNGKATPHPKAQLRLANLQYIVSRLSEFYTPDEARMWLYSRNDLLDGEIAMELIHQNRTDEVLQAIDRLASLTYL